METIKRRQGRRRAPGRLSSVQATRETTTMEVTHFNLVEIPRLHIVRRQVVVVFRGPSAVRVALVQLGLMRILAKLHRIRNIRAPCLAYGKNGRDAPARGGKVERGAQLLPCLSHSFVVLDLKFRSPPSSQVDPFVCPSSPSLRPRRAPLRVQVRRLVARLLVP